MKRIALAAALLISALCGAQDFKAQYDRQTRMVGYSGVGVETILDRWEAAEPDNTAMLEGRFHYFFNKSKSTQVVAKNQAKYLGADPVISLKDSTGRDVGYFEENFFVDSLFALSQKAIDRAIALEPSELAWRVDKISSLILYEKESPELAGGEILRMIDYNAAKHPSWTHYGKPATEDTFIQAVQEYCFTFYRNGTPDSYGQFRTVSEKMNKLYPKKTDFINNLGAYYLVFKGAPKKALKWYEKSLKINPSDYSAARNCVLIARREKNTKLEKKYLPVLINATEDELERKGYEARLEALR
jgi:tetratricopeptide (TPR) repeat protein